MSAERFEHHFTIKADGATSESESGWYDVLEDETSVYIFDRGAGMLVSRHADAHAAGRQARKLAQSWDEQHAPKPETPWAGTHTAGSWETWPRDRGVVMVRAGDIAIALTYEPNQALNKMRGPLNPMADAQLMAAAPELAAALTDLRKQLREHLKLDVRKHYSLMLADVAADKALHKAGVL